MTIKRISQDNSSLKQNIEVKLILLKELSGLSQIEIATRLGYQKDVFAQIKSGFSNGSTQLFSGLNLFFELETLKRNGQCPTSDAIEIRALIAEIREENESYRDFKRMINLARSAADRDKAKQITDELVSRFLEKKTSYRE